MDAQSLSTSPKRALHYLRAGTWEAYIATPKQWRLNDPAAWNAQGQALYADADRRYALGQWKDTFGTYYTEVLPSGPWNRDDGSPQARFGIGQHPADMVKLGDGTIAKHLPVVYQDVAICGTLESFHDPNGQQARTSQCVFVTDKWCLTANGTLYRLGKKLN